MGKELKKGFCYISVNKILKMTSQYNTSRGSFTELLFPCCSCTDSVCIAVCSKFREIPS